MAAVLAALVTAFVALLVFLAWLHKHPTKHLGRELRATKQKLQRAENLLDRLQRHAIRDRDVEPFAEVVLSEIRDHQQKELAS